MLKERRQIKLVQEMDSRRIGYEEMSLRNLAGGGHQSDAMSIMSHQMTPSAFQLNRIDLNVSNGI